jgi:hypothetical protein
LKNEFVETICRLYLEKNDPDILRDILIWEEQTRKENFGTKHECTTEKETPLSLSRK